MKKIIYILLLSSSNICFSQKDSIKYKWGIGLQLNTIDKIFPFENPDAELDFYDSHGAWKNLSYSLGIVGKHNVNERFSLRLKSGVIQVNQQQHRDVRDESIGAPCGSCFLGDLTIKQRRYYISPEVIGTVSKGNLGIYGGTGILYTKYKEFLQEGYGIYYTDETFSTIQYDNESKVVIPGGFSVGLSAFFGVSFHLLKHFSIGAEISDSYVYRKLGGNVELTVSQSIPSNYTATSYYLFSESGFTHSKGIVSFTTIYLF